MASTIPSRWRSSGMQPSPTSRRASVPRPVIGTPSTSTSPLAGSSPMIASISSVCPLPSTPAMPTISPPCTLIDDAVERTAAGLGGGHRLGGVGVGAGSERDRARLGVGLDGELDQLEADAVGDRACSRLGRRQLGAHHQLGQLFGGHRRRVGDLADRLAGADDGDRVGVGEHLVEVVGDEDHGRTVGGELAQRGEQLLHLLGHEHGGRLVEDQDLGAAVEHLEDLDALLLADAEVGHQLVGIDRQAVLTGQLADAAAGLAGGEVEGRARLAPEDDVLPHREVVGEHEVLEHHADAELDGGGRRAEVLLHAADVDLALVGLVGAVERLHQRRLAGAVLADDGVDRAVAHLEVHPVVGDDPGEALDDVAQLDRQVRRCRFRVHPGAFLADRAPVRRPSRPVPGRGEGAHSVSGRPR